MQIIRNDQSPPPNFRNLVNIDKIVDDMEVLSSIPPIVLTVQDLKLCYQFKVGEIGDFEIRETYEKLCMNGHLKDEFNIIAKK